MIWAERAQGDGVKALGAGDVICVRDDGLLFRYGDIGSIGRECAKSIFKLRKVEPTHTPQPGEEMVVLLEPHKGSVMVENKEGYTFLLPLRLLETDAA